ncbi:DedA family protein [Nocardia miyunensis]|uniref:DedA family protein n=1 Tax=Nocardia miyunensis TaxID=282684 RepID=UPI000834C0E4|nr:DedA family protein [Nocardia miyunensis]
MDSLVQRVLSLPAAWTYLVVALLVCAEEAMVFGLLVPGDTAAILAGVAANRGRLDLPTTLALVVIAAIVGASVGFGTGRIFGARILRWAIFERHRERLDRSGRYFERHGSWAVILGRFSTFFRTMLPQLVGMSSMRYSRFLFTSTLGAIIWGCAMVMAGYAIGESFTAIIKRVDSWAALVVVVLIVLGVVYWKWRRHHRAPTTPDED